MVSGIDERGPADAGCRGNYPLETPRRSMRKLGSRSKFSIAVVATAFCFQLAMKAQGASSWMIACTWLYSAPRPAVFEWHGLVCAWLRAWTVPSTSQMTPWLQ